MLRTSVETTSTSLDVSRVLDEGNKRVNKKIQREKMKGRRGTEEKPRIPQYPYVLFAATNVSFFFLTTTFLFSFFSTCYFVLLLFSVCCVTLYLSFFSFSFLFFFFFFYFMRRKTNSDNRSRYVCNSEKGHERARKVPAKA